MRGIEHEWHGKEDLCCGAETRSPGAPHPAGAA
jgi:hypothetical protein